MSQNYVLPASLDEVTRAFLRWNNLYNMWIEDDLMIEGLGKLRKRKDVAVWSISDDCAICAYALTDHSTELHLVPYGVIFEPGPRACYAWNELLECCKRVGWIEEYEEATPQSYKDEKNRLREESETIAQYDADPVLYESKWKGDRRTWWDGFPNISQDEVEGYFQSKAVPEDKRAEIISLLSQIADQASEMKTLEDYPVFIDHIIQGEWEEHLKGIAHFRFDVEDAEGWQHSFEDEVKDTFRLLDFIQKNVDGDETQEPPPSKRRRNRKRGPTTDVLADCQNAMEKWLDEGKTLREAADFVTRDDETILKWIPNVLGQVGPDKREKWIRTLKAINKAEYLGEFSDV